MMGDTVSSEVIDLAEMDAEAWATYAEEQGWSDGMPLVQPTEKAVARMMEACRGDNEPIPPITPRLVVPTMQSLAANAVMAGCRPAYFPVVLAALRSVLVPEYNLHGTLATTHPCAPAVIINGPLRLELGVNCGSNCFGQGWRANASIGRALELILLNVGGAKPAIMDRSTMGSPAKYSFCFGENEEESPWAPYHVRHGFDASDSVVTVMSGESPHNINDHGSTTGRGLLTTFAGSIAQPGSNNLSGKGPMILVIGPEHAATLHRDGFTPETIQEYLFEHARVPADRIAPGRVANYAEASPMDAKGRFKMVPNPEAIHLFVAGGAGKHSAHVPSFGGTAIVSTRVKTAG